MKKKLLIIGAIVLIIITTILIILLNKTTYVIKVSLVDDKSPDRILTVYNNKDEKVDFKRIELPSGTILCDEINPSVYYGNLNGISELQVVLKDNSIVKAQVIKEEVK
jgi:hypothetical protein